jgi:hypothetical protein
MALFEVISKTRDKNPDSEVIVPEWVRPGYKPPQDPAAEPQETEAAEPEPQKPVVQEPEPPKTVVPAPAAPEPAFQQPLLQQPVAPQPVAAPEPVAPQPLVQQPTATEAPPQTLIQEQVPDPITLPDDEDEDAPATTSTWEPRSLGEPGETKTKTKAETKPITWSTEDQRLTVSLNYLSCTVAAIGVLLLLVTTFVLGRITASPATTIAGAGGAAVQRESGKYYMVIERLPDRSSASMVEATRIAAFCNANNEPASVQRIPPGKTADGKPVGQGYLIVWSGTPFDKKTGEEVRAHALKLQNELGLKYANQYGSKYKFAQPQKNGRVEPTLYLYKPKKR